MASKSISKTLVWILMAMLILGLGGFGITNLGGTVRTVGSVGDAEISIDDYARALQTDIRAIAAETGQSLSFAQAQQMGVDSSVLSRLVTSAALDHETARVGISIGDENLRQQILDIPNFRGAGGTFDREAYKFALQQAGLSEAEFESDIRSETARSLLQAAVISGISAPDGFTDPLMSYLGERRDFTWTRLETGDLEAELPEPAEDDLVAYHQSHLSEFTIPESKRITFAWLTPDMIIEQVELDDGLLRAAYDERLDEYQTPERRLVERLAFADDAAATAAKSALDSGESTFEALVEERGLALGDIDLGDVARADLGAAGDGVFAAETGNVVGPLDSPVGPALFRVNAVLPAQSTSFEEALPELRDELAADRARRMIDSRIDEIDDLLAGGATIEELAQDTDMHVSQIDWNDANSEDIGAYAAFREAAAQITPDDYPVVKTLEDGGIFTMRLDAVIEPEVRPLDEVRDEVREGWMAQARLDALKAQVSAQLEQLLSGQSMDELGMTSQAETGVTRTGFIPGTPAGFLDTVFGLEKGAVATVDGPDAVFVVKVDDILPPDAENEELVQLRTVFADRAAADLANDMFLLLADDIRNRAGIELNQQALNAVHANFQ